MIAYSDFVAIFPEFADTTKFPEAGATFWIGQGYAQISPRLGRQRDLAVMLFTAHNVVLAAQAAKAMASGGVSGQATGVVSSKSVDKVSVSYDTAATAIQNAGFFNATSYGQRFYRLMQAASVGQGYVPYLGPDGTVAGVY